MRRLSLPVAVFAAVMILALPLAAQEGNDKKATKEAGKTDIELVEIEPFFYCAVEMTGSYTQHPDAFMKLYTEAGKQGLPMAGMPFGIYWNSPHDTAEEALKWEIGLAVPEDKEIQPPLSRKGWEHILVAKKDFEGAFGSEEMSAAYSEVSGWIEENGYELSGPMMEKYLSSPSPNEEGEFVGKVQIIFPVQKKKQ